MSKLVTIYEKQELLDLIETLKDSKYLAYDIETTGVKRDSDIIGFSVSPDPKVGYYVVLKEYDKQNDTLTKRSTCEAVDEFLKFISSKKLIMHNAKFDCNITRLRYGIELMSSLHTDTQAMVHLLYEEERTALKKVAARFFGEDDTKEQEDLKASVLANGGIWKKDTKEMYKANTKVLAKYGAKDAVLTVKVFLKLIPELSKAKLVDFFYKDEVMPLLKTAGYEMNTTGLKINLEQLRKLQTELEKECTELHSEILEEIWPYVKEKFPGDKKNNTFKITSNEKLAWLLFIRLGNTFKHLTDKGRDTSRMLTGEVPYGNAVGKKKKFIAECLRAGLKPEKFMKCDVNVLTEFAGKYKWVAKLLEYKKLTKLKDTYAYGFEKFIQYGVIYPHFNQQGTTSGRFSSSNPNFQNIPRRDIENAKRIRKVIQSRKDHLFIGADYSQVEPRILAAYAQDPMLVEAFKKDQDFYSVIGIPVYKVEGCSLYKKDPNWFGNKYSIFRDNTKTLVLANNYGQTANKLAQGLTNENGEHYSLEEAEELIESYFELYPGVKAFIHSTHEEVKENGVVYSMYGRPRHIPKAKIIKMMGNRPHKELSYQYRTLLNLAVNFKMQSTAASIINRAAISFYKKVKEEGIRAKLVMQVHDELIAEAHKEDAEKAAQILKDCMESAVELPNVPLKAEPVIADNLADLK